MARARSSRQSRRFLAQPVRRQEQRARPSGAVGVGLEHRRRPRPERAVEEELHAAELEARAALPAPPALPDRAPKLALRDGGGDAELELPLVVERPPALLGVGVHVLHEAHPPAQEIGLGEPEIVLHLLERTLRENRLHEPDGVFVHDPGGLAGRSRGR